MKREAAEEDQRQRSQRRTKSGGEQQHVDRLAFLFADNQFIKQCFLKEISDAEHDRTCNNAAQIDIDTGQCDQVIRQIHRHHQQRTVRPVDNTHNAKAEAEAYRDSRVNTAQQESIY